MSTGDWHWLDALRRRWAAEQTEWAREYFTRMACEDPLEDHPMAAPLTYRQSTLRVRKIRWKYGFRVDEAIRVHDALVRCGARPRTTYNPWLGVMQNVVTTVTWPEAKQ